MLQTKHLKPFLLRSLKVGLDLVLIAIRLFDEIILELLVDFHYMLRLSSTRIAQYCSLLYLGNNLFYIIKLLRYPCSFIL